MTHLVPVAAAQLSIREFGKTWGGLRYMAYELCLADVPIGSSGLNVYTVCSLGQQKEPQ